VLGGTGFVGRAPVCQRLAARWPATVRVPTRRPATATRALPAQWSICCRPTCTTPASLRRLLSGHDAVVNLVAILHGNAAAFDRVHVALPRTLARACQATGVRRVVHVSALGAVAGRAVSVPAQQGRWRGRA
jgi:uncharacterized protein YbjT (DUF2867 family)